MGKMTRKSKRFIALITVFTLLASPLLISKSPVATTQTASDVWLIGGW